MAPLKDWIMRFLRGAPSVTSVVTIPAEPGGRWPNLKPATSRTIHYFQPVETFLASGWTVGAGIERKLNSSWSVRAEYLYTNFGTARTNDQFNYGSPAVGTQTDQRQTQFDQPMQIGRIGFAYAFDPFR